MKLKIIFLFTCLCLVGCTRYYESSCNLFVRNESALCVIALVGALPTGLAKYHYEKKKEEKREREFITNRNKGVINGDREALELCAQTCHLSAYDSEEQVALSHLASEKLILFDDQNQTMTIDQVKAMIKAYSNLQQDLAFSDPVKVKYIERAWELIKEATEKHGYYEIQYSGAEGIASRAFLLNYQLYNKDIESVEPIFSQCLSNVFWSNAHFKLFDLPVLFFCQSALRIYLLSLKGDDQDTKVEFKEKMFLKWEEEWNLALKRKSKNNH